MSQINTSFFDFSDEEPCFSTALFPTIPSFPTVGPKKQEQVPELTEEGSLCGDSEEDFGFYLSKELLEKLDDSSEEVINKNFNESIDSDKEISSTETKGDTSIEEGNSSDAEQKISPIEDNKEPGEGKKKKFEEREGDWNCMKCKNLNFAFRTNCNRCKTSKVESEKLQEVYKKNIQNMQTMIMYNTMLKAQAIKINMMNNMQKMANFQAMVQQNKDSFAKAQ